MSPQKENKFPPLLLSQKQSVQNKSIQRAEEEREGDRDVPVQPHLTCKLSTTGSYIYTGAGRKPPLLVQIEGHLNRELHRLNADDPEYQQNKLQVYSKAFGFLIKEFKTYQPILSAIKKEYETTLAYQQDQIRELEPLRSRLRLLREECERKIQARYGEELTEIGALKREKQQLQRDIETMREREQGTQKVIECLQHELSDQYLRYREERDSRKLLIGQLSYLTRSSGREDQVAGGITNEDKDPVQLQLALRVCREDLTKAQEELTRIKAEYWDVVPQSRWDTLTQTHKQTLLQLKTLQGDFNQLRNEHNTLLELQREGHAHAKTSDSGNMMMDGSVSQGVKQIQSSQPASDDLTVQELRSVTPLKPDEETALHKVAQSDGDRNNDIVSSQLPDSQLTGSGEATLNPTLVQSGENAESGIFQPATDVEFF